jgi:hypothetical protein
MEPSTLAIFGITGVTADALSKPATKLIETLASGIGAVYEPTRIRRKAQAEADALLTLANANAESAEIAQRTVHRIANRELRRQKNLENVARPAVELLPGAVSEEPVSDDWIAQFLDHCQDVSDPQMQSLWSRILAGEVTSPGSFSPRTLQVVKTLRPQDAHQFTSYCQFLWYVRDRSIGFFIVPNISQRMWAPQTKDNIWRAYEANGVDGIVRVHLQSLNLIHMGAGGELSLSPHNGSVWLRYHDKTHFLRHNDSERQLVIEADLLTDIGRELAPISGAKPNVEFEQLVLRAMPGGFVVAGSE